MKSGVSIERQTVNYIDPSCTIKPLKDRIFVRPLEWEPSNIVAAVRDGRPVRGVAVARPCFFV